MEMISGRYISLTAWRQNYHLRCSSTRPAGVPTSRWFSGIKKKLQTNDPSQENLGGRVMGMHILNGASNINILKGCLKYLAKSANRFFLEFEK